jgi:hypothetical protein
MRTRKLALRIIGASLLVLTGFVSPSAAGVHVNVMIPPPLVIAAPPPVVVIPGTYVYSAPDVEADILFYHGYWWRPYEGRWYRSSRYDGDWRYFPHDRVPHAVRDLPPDRRHYRPADGRIPHDDMRRNWKQWEREKHWDKHDRKEARKEIKHDQKAERKEMKHDEKVERKEMKHDRKVEHKEMKRDQKAEHKERKDHGDRGDHGDSDRGDHGRGR